ncbi:hypothetical protein NUACC26_066860 [Scytonema sp. NUACC26]
MGVYKPTIFEKWLAVVLITLLPPIIPPMYWGEIRKIQFPPQYIGLG